MNCVRWVHMNLISITFGDDDSTNGLMRMEAKRQTDIMVLRNFKLNHMTRNQRPFVIIMWWMVVYLFRDVHATNIRNIDR